MDNNDLEKTKEYFQTLEKSFEALTPEVRGKIYSKCAENCVKGAVFDEQKRAFDKCGGNLDLVYTKFGNSDHFFGKVIEPGHIYEIGYPHCTCHMVASGFANSPTHCECSRQSILYILHKLMPNKKINVEILGTVLSGCDKCSFRVTIE